MTDRDCSRCVFARPYGGEDDNRCASWSCEFIDYKEAAKAYEAIAEIVRCKDCKWYSVKYFDGSDRPNPLCRVFNRYFLKADSFCSYGERGRVMRLIDADRLLGEYDEIEIVAYHKDNVYEYISTKQIDNAPTVDAVEVRHGRWIRVRDPSETLMNYYVCDKCGNMEACESNYCPHCGARMKGADR